METSTVLFLAANPMHGQPLQLGEECRAIEDKIRGAKFRDRIQFLARWAARPSDLLEAMSDHSPSVLHFSGHGAGDHGLCFQSEDGNPVSVSAEGLAEVMRAEGGNVKLVVLNACFSEVQARALITQIPCVIGMPGAIGDRTGITYAASFYRALASGKSVANSHQHGVAALALYRSSGFSRDIETAATSHLSSISPRPILLVRPDTNAELVYVVHTSDARIIPSIPTTPEPHRAVCILTVKAKLKDFDEKVIARVTAELRRLSNDLSLEITDIEEGSVKLTIRLSSASAKILEDMRATGKLDKVCEFAVLAFAESQAASEDQDRIVTHQKRAFAKAAAAQVSLSISASVTPGWGSPSEPSGQDHRFSVLQRSMQDLQNLATRLCDNSSDATGLVQDTLESALRQAPPRNTSNASAWLTYIMRSRFIAHQPRPQERLAVTGASHAEGNVGATPKLRDVELRIAVAEGVLSHAEADALGEEARRNKQSPLALLVEQGRLSEDSFQSLLAKALNDPAWRADGAVSSSSTYSNEALPPMSYEPPFPVAGWDRYTSVRFLGQGGMGMVFLAIDTRLRREVALKFMHGYHPELVRQLISAARIQAQVTHERICKVYEIGEVEGKVYVAMQYIAGRSLDQLADVLTVEQKVTLMRGVAESIHAAHSQGIIHRDIKPWNIIVECGDDGELRPYVTDFGLARSLQDVGETPTGSVVGTPRYMAPEQAQGAASGLDHRADVYSLGATLYYLITGLPAVPGETVAEVFHNLIEREPRPPRAYAPGIPVDLEAIVLKCLEKDRSARYDSARALADDLGRFLHGEPVVARPASTWYRLRKRLAKQRGLMAMAAVAFFALVTALGWALNTRVEAERERFARRFSEAVASIESTAQYSALAPRHDIRADRRAIRAKLAEIEDEVERGGDAAAGPGHDALGRGYLALGDDVKAREHLAAAWHAGFREPDVAYALAQVMGHRYQQDLLAAEQIEDSETRTARKRAIGWRYRDAALGFLAQSQAAKGPPAPEYVAALAAFYEGRLDEALRHLDAIGASPPWSFEIPQLRGDILLGRALESRDRGDEDGARDDFEQGRTSFAAAADIGQSVPAVYGSLGDLEYFAMVMGLRKHEDVTPAFERALAATSHALAIAPDDYDALVLEARVQRTMAGYPSSQGFHVEDLLGKALADAQRAIDLSPTRSEAHIEIARIYQQWGSYRSERHEDPSEQLRQAVAAFDAIPTPDRDITYYTKLGLTFSTWADHEDRHGADGREHRSQSINAYTRALQLAEVSQRQGQQREILVDLAIELFRRATASRSKDPDTDLQQAIAALARVKPFDRIPFSAYLYEGRIYEAMAQHSRARGGDPGPDLRSALAAYRGGLAIHAGDADLLDGVGTVSQALANAAWDRGDDPAPLLEEAQAAFQSAMLVDPGRSSGYSHLGEVHIQRAGFQRAQGKDPSASVEEAVALLNQAVEKMPNDPTVRADLARAYNLLAAHDLERWRDPHSSLRSAVAVLQPALYPPSSDARIWIAVAETQGLSAQLAARQGRGKDSDFPQVARAFEQAIALDPENDDHAILFGRFCRAWAMFERQTGSDPHPVLTRGLALANQVLARHPSSPDARVVRASLTLVGAQVARDAADRRAQAERAQQDFVAAITANPLLENVWAGEAALAKQLAR